MRLHAVKLPHHKSSAEQATIKPDLPKQVAISLSQGGTPCTPLVQVGDEVLTGQIIGDSDAFVSAPVHSSVTGTVTGFTEVLNIFGNKTTCVVIETGEKQQLHESVLPPVIYTREDFIAAIRKSGSVGLGGAGFPTHVKFSYDRERYQIDTLIVNGAECEPYITSDYREFMENGEDVIEGAKLIMKYLDIPKTVIGIEADKKKAILHMKNLAENEADISVLKLPSAFPQGAEKVLIHTATGRVVPDGELPMSAGCLVVNSSTVSFIARYLRTGVPLIHRRLTIDGDIVNKPMNIMVPVGTQLKEIIELTDLRSEPDRVIFGGPMMGISVFENTVPVMKTTNAILLFGQTKTKPMSACIRCGKCLRVCAMNLMPVFLEKAYDAGDVEELKNLNVNSCMNCGSCSYICPAKRSLSERIQLGKALVRSKSD